MLKSSSLRKLLVCGTACTAIALGTAAQAQTTLDAPPPPPAPIASDAPPPANDANGNPKDDADGQVIVTGSRLKQNPNNSALPLQIITNRDLQREGINSPEQLISFLSTNGNGADNLASNSDVVTGAQRGTNGLSAANLRGQGSAATLVLLNGRRVAAHGLQGSAVDVNQVPFALIDRVEILKDGASAIYGTDAVGGVINFITKTNFKGVTLTGFTDQTELGDAPIYRLSAAAGFGDLDDDHYNIMGGVSKSWNGVLYGNDRKFVNGNQPNRGLSIDTRGTPIATAFPLNVATNSAIGISQNGTLLGATTTTNPAYLATLFIPGTTTRADGGINTLDLPGGAGCNSYDGGLPYDEVLWAIPGAKFACSYDTGRAATLQQPIQTLTYYGRATAAFGEHRIFTELTGSKADSAKRFSENQYTANATTLPIAYPLNATTATTYNSIYDQIAAVFPAIGAVGDRTPYAGVQNDRYGLPISFRYRCIACGRREYETTTKTFRLATGAEGPLFADFEYRVGASYARSESSSTLGTGYHFLGVYNNTVAGNAGSTAGITGAVVGGADSRAPTAPGATAPGIVGLFNSGILNPFSLTQSAAALAGLQAVSAEGTVLYGGKYEVRQFDGSVSGSLFALPGGRVQLAVGVDYRKEEYSFNGSAAAAGGRAAIFNAAFDNVNALTPKSRTVKAAYGEISFPIFKPLEITAAARIDDYTGFGTTTNPKVTAKFRPVNWLLFRGSYNTGFRVPTFNQIFNGTTISPNPGNARFDPTTCSAGVVNAAIPGCAAITPDTLSGGNANLGPETSEQYSGGVVFQPAPRFSASLDFWHISVDNVIGALTLDQLLFNQALFQSRVTRTGGVITQLDIRADNIGARRTEGLEVTLRGGIDAFGGSLNAGLDGTRLLKKRERFLETSPFGPSLINLFTYAGDLGLKWKHNAFLTYANGPYTLSFSQIYRNGYRNNALPASATRPDYNPRVKSYTLYNLAATARIKNDLSLTFGVRNVFDRDPPFAITYDSNTGSGSSWEPRVADPRGRSFTVQVETHF